MNLQAIDNFTRKLGPVSALIDEVMETVLPKATATACNWCATGAGTHCHTYCDHCGGTQFAVYNTNYYEDIGTGENCIKHCFTQDCNWVENQGACQPGTPC